MRGHSDKSYNVTPTHGYKWRVASKAIEYEIMIECDDQSARKPAIPAIIAVVRGVT